MASGADNVRRYGAAPFSVVLVHGGPGGAGEMAPLARRLGRNTGLIEALQTKHSIAALTEELHAQIAAHAATPAILVGHSWGAWLSLIFAARYPALAKRLILIASSVFEDEYAEQMKATRRARLTPKERVEMDRISAMLDDPAVKHKGALFGQFGRLFDKTECFDPVDEPQDRFETAPDIFESVWPEAAALRSSGALLEIAAQVRCPVLAIHGDFDPSPAEGVRAPLARALKDFAFIVLKNCGHTPWAERAARDALYAILERECK